MEEIKKLDKELERLRKEKDNIIVSNLNRAIGYIQDDEKELAINLIKIAMVGLE